MALTPRTMKWALNLYPPYLFSGVRIKYIAPDWKEMIVQVRKSLLNRNYVGTIFGGTMYSAADPMFMLMLIKIMGIKDYIIWDKGAEIDFKKPGRSHLTYHFVVKDAVIRDIKAQLETAEKLVPTFLVNGVDKEGSICVTVRKTVYIRKKKPEQVSLIHEEETPV